MGNLIRRREAPSSSGGLYFATPKPNVQFIHSGCALLDCVLGGGWPLGRISNIVGDKSTGKTLLAIEACANALRQHQNCDVAYIEAEAAFDRKYAGALGLPMDRINLFEDISTVETLFDFLSEFIGVDLKKDGKERRKPRLKDRPGLVVIDSLDALTDEAEAERGIREGSYGAAKAKKMSELFRRLIRSLGETRTAVLVVSQVRDNIGVTFGRKHTRSGGRALDFYASIVLWLAHMKTMRQVINKIDRATGVAIKAKCDKNKIALPFRECEFTIRFGYGVEDIESGIAFLASIGKASLVPALRDFKRLRGREFSAAREAMNKAVIEQWYAIERGFVSERGKYA